MGDSYPSLVLDKRLPLLFSIRSSSRWLWRAELYHHSMTRWFGDKAFPIYKVIFTILFVGRPVALILLGISNANTLDLPPAIAYVLAGILFLPFAYTMYSVAHYFGLDRALR